MTELTQAALEQETRRAEALKAEQERQRLAQQAMDDAKEAETRYLNEQKRLADEAFAERQWQADQN